MKVKHEWEVMERKCHAHQQEVRQLQEVVSTRVWTLHSALGRVRQPPTPLHRLKPHPPLSPISHQLTQKEEENEEEEEEEEERREKCRLIQERVDSLSSYLDHIRTTSHAHQSRLKRDLARQVKLLETELGSGGNAKFSPPAGGHSGHWHRACVELVKSRFSAANWQVGVACC